MQTAILSWLYAETYTQPTTPDQGSSGFGDLWRVKTASYHPAPTPLTDNPLPVNKRDSEQLVLWNAILVFSYHASASQAVLSVVPLIFAFLAFLM